MKLSVNTNISSVFTLAFKDQSIEEKELNKFITEFKRLYERINSNESEENQKNIIADFLKDVYYKPNYEVNTKGRIDLAIHNGKSAKDSVGVIIEAKKPSNKSEMITAEKPNVKAFQEILLYYLGERIKDENIEIKNLIITNISDWFIIDAQDFEKIITKDIIKSYKSFTEGTLVNESNAIFYNEIAKNFFDKCVTELPCVKLNLEIINKLVNSQTEKDTEELTNYYKLLSPQHLLKLRFANDSNKLNNDFYNELLHIIGLKETADGGKKIIDRKPEKDRNEGSLIENTITILKNRNKLQNITNLEQFGDTEEKQLFSVGLELCITWLNRILFLKLLEGQLIKYNNDDRETYAFLNTDKIKDYDELDELFFEVLAIKTNDRPKEITKKFGNIPYLNSSLFEPTELEQKVLEINGIKNRYELEIFSNTVLKDGAKRKTGAMLTLNYLFDFLDSYDFASDKTKKIQAERKTIINASVLGLIFEKINGYKDGSFYTPGFITEYMCRETIRKAVIQKFNDAKKWEHQNWNDLQRAVIKLSVEDANKIINEVRICDPAVGSGHFLVSALNEMIAIKQDLQLFEHDKNGPFRGLTIKIENDELVTRLNGELFSYNYKDENSQRIQETLFNQKRTVIENCLFGVDINPKSVMICQLRLWIELLKNAYYINPTCSTFPSAGGVPAGRGGLNNPTENGLELQTLPNIDINIKCGNSLVSRFKVRDGFFENSDKFKTKFNDYKTWVSLYKSTNDKKAKSELSKKITAFKTEFKSIESTDLKNKQKKIDDLAYQLYNKYNTDQLFGSELTDKQQKEKIKIESDLQKLIDDKNESVNNPIFANALEWRFEFPEVLDEKGNYTGFDAVIGNPPYFSLAGHLNTQNHFASEYKTFTKGVDIYCLFIELSKNILSHNGNIGFIVSSKWKTTSYGKQTRFFLRDNVSDLQIIDFGNYQIFDEATVDTCIIVFKNNLNNIDYISFNLKEVSESIEHFLSSESREIFYHKNQDIWNLSGNKYDSIKSKIESIGTPICESNYIINRGVTTGFNDAFIINTETKNRIINENNNSKELIKPLLRGRDINRFNTDNIELWLIYIPKGFTIKNNSANSNFNIQGNIVSEPPPRYGTMENDKAANWFEKNYSAIWNHIEPYKYQLIKRLDKGDFWWELRACAYLNYFEKEKIVFTKASKTQAFAFDLSKSYLLNTCYFLHSDNSKSLLAILNSNLIKFSFLKFYQSGGIEGEITLQAIEKIPIPKIPSSISVKFNKLVDKILALKAKDAKVDTSALENEIDNLVYALYDLTPEEIAIVEESIKK